MTKTNVMRPLARVNAFVTVAVLATAALLPAVMLSSTASGAQLTNRFIDMSATQTSEGSGRDGADAFGDDVTYSVGYTIATSGNIDAMVIEFCSDSPIIGDACDGANGDGFDLNFATLVITADTGTAGLGTFTIDAVTDADTLVLNLGAPVAVTAGETVRFDLGFTGNTDGITNPNVEGTFYARMLTFSDDTVADDYDDETPGAYTDDGGIALSVNNELTITARVQEVLSFCIGTELSSATAINTTGVAGYDPLDSCIDISGTDLSLDVVDSNTIATTSNIDTPNDGVAMLRTNAINGAVMYYKAEQDTSSGKLKIASATCSGVSLSDACFNSVGTTRAAITAGTENFGVALKERVTTTGGATNAVTCNTQYQGDGTAGCTGAVAGNNYAWNDTGAFDTIASSAGPVDDELVALQFAATASPTTPTGLYTVTANFVATATF